MQGFKQLNVKVGNPNWAKWLFLETARLCLMMAVPRIDPREMAYRQMLINLDKLLTDRELSSMKFISKAYGIGDRNRSKIDSCLELFEKLEERSLLGVDNLSYLKELLNGCTDNRQDVINVVSQFEKFRHVDKRNAPGKPGMPIQIILSYVISSQWLSVCRVFCQPLLFMVL